MTFDEARAYWFGRTNYEQISPQASDLKLDRMRSLLVHLGNPHQQLRIIHVAGSKGKGSTSAMLAAILHQAGFRTGLFTSPHLCRPEERFQINGQSIISEELTALLEKVREAEEQMLRECPGSPCTFFEIAPAVCFLYFALQRVGFAVIEVGLGGRFDSTNVCSPLLTVITSISYDHTQLLGNRLESIAMEKAGIIKNGCSTISGVVNPEARSVIQEVCRERHSPIYELNKDFRYNYGAGRVTATAFHKPIVQVVTTTRSWPSFELSLLGEHQAANAALAIASVERLQSAGRNIGDEAVRSGLANVYWPARQEVIERQPFIVLDCAHNVASAEALVDTLLQSFSPARRLLVFASSSDKDIEGIFHVLAPHFAHAFLTRYDSPRSVAPERLATMMRQVTTLPVSVFPNARSAFQAALDFAKPDDLICITGSVFLAGEVRSSQLV